MGSGSELRTVVVINIVRKSKFIRHVLRPVEFAVLMTQVTLSKLTTVKCRTVTGCRKKEVRTETYCDEWLSGTNVKNASPLTCNICQTYISVAPSSSPQFFCLNDASE